MRTHMRSRLARAAFALASGLVLAAIAPLTAQAATSTYQVTSTIAVGPYRPSGVAVDATTNTVYVTNTLGKARPIFHHKRDSIQAHLTIVFAALAVARYLQDRTGLPIKRLVQTLRPLRAVTITIAGQPVTAQPRLGPDATAILDKIPDLAGH
jgi:hypothetical protein